MTMIFSPIMLIDFVLFCW